MKIDLHIHTKPKSKNSGEGKKRELPSIDFFFQKLNSNNVGIAAITNHDLLDVKQYNDLKEENIKQNYGILILPGVELEVYYNNSRKHINLIFSDSFDNEKLEEINEKINKYNNCLKELKLLNKIKDLFNEFKPLYYLDSKRNDTYWQDDEIKQIKKDNILKTIICDVNNKNSFLRYRANNFNVLVGSDLKDWDNYDERAKELIDIDIQINSFDKFLKIFCYEENQTFLQLLNEEKNKTVELKNFSILIDDKNVKIGDLKLFERTNIIFGPKASGKTKILESIYENSFINDCKKIFYKSNEIKKQFEQIIKKYEEISKNDNNIKIEQNKKSFFESLDFILNFNDFSYNDFKLWKSWFSSIKKIKINVNNFFPLPKIESDKREIDFLKEFIQSINSSLLIVNKNQEIVKNYGYEKYEDDLKQIKKNLIKTYIEKNKNNWKFKLYKAILDKVNEVSIKNNGTQQKPYELGLFKRWQNRNELLIHINSLKQHDFNQKLILNNKVVLIGRKPGKIIYEIISYNFKDLEKLKNSKIVEINKIKTNIDKLIKILKIENCNFNYKDYFKDKEDLKNLIEKIKENPYKSKIFISDENEIEIDLSNGEKALFCLNDTLVKNKDCEYFLLDEPDAYLGSEGIFEYLIPWIWELNKLKKKVIIATHNPALAINSIPFNMIYRGKTRGDLYYTMIGNPWINKFIDINDSNKTRDFSELLIEEFEREIKHFNFRKDIYEG